VKRYRFGDEVLDLLTAGANCDAARKVRYVGTPREAVLLDHDQILGHRSLPPGLSQDRGQRTLRHLVTHLARDSDGARALWVPVLPAGAGLAIEPPAVVLQRLDSVPYLHRWRGYGRSVTGPWSGVKTPGALNRAAPRPNI